MNRVSRGFTLLEILAALVIAAVGIAAMSKVVGSAASVLQVSEQRLVGNWLASNRIAELRLSRGWPAAAETSREAQLGGRTWHYQEKIVTTADPDVLRVDIEVFSDKDHTRLAANVFGYLTRYSPPTASQQEAVN